MCCLSRVREALSGPHLQVAEFLPILADYFSANSHARQFVPVSGDIDDHHGFRDRSDRNCRCMLYRLSMMVQPSSVSFCSMLHTRVTISLVGVTVMRRGQPPALIPRRDSRRLFARPSPLSDH